MLTENAIKAAKPRSKPWKLYDNKGLFLLVKPSGSKLWQQKFRIAGREKLLSHGQYPEITLRRARQKCEEARRQLDEGNDPAVAKQATKALAKAAAIDARENTFQAVAEEWFEAAKARRKIERRPLSPKTIKKTEWLLNLRAYREADGQRSVHPLRSFGARPIRDIAKTDVRAVISDLVKAEKLETAHRMLDRMVRVFKFAISKQKAGTNPAAEYADSEDAQDALPSVAVQHHAAITDPARVGELLRAIDGYAGQPATIYALKMAPLVFVRPGELRGARWEEFDLDGKQPEWRIPGERMKMGEPHIVPLSSQAVALLRDLHPITGPDGLLFPSLRSSARPISNNSLNAALRRLGYSKAEATAHGFRTTASTLLNEQGFSPDVIELQLAHKERDQIRGAYNRSARLPERRAMMQRWADYLDGLRRNKRVLSPRNAS